MKKLRFLDGINRNPYLKELKTQDAVIIMKTRLNMIDLKANFKGKYSDEKCELCMDEEDNTEHMFECKKIKALIKSDISLKNLSAPTKALSDYINQVMLIKGCVRLGDVGVRARNKSLPKL